jgi:hypothetical protein
MSCGIHAESSYSKLFSNIKIFELNAESGEMQNFVGIHPEREAVGNGAEGNLEPRN